MLNHSFVCFYTIYSSLFYFYVCFSFQVDDQSDEYAALLEKINLVFTFIFTFEALLKLMAYKLVSSIPHFFDIHLTSFQRHTPCLIRDFLFYGESLPQKRTLYPTSFTNFFFSRITSETVGMSWIFVSFL